jgi:hypothetical protein
MSHCILVCLPHTPPNLKPAYITSPRTLIYNLPSFTGYRRLAFVKKGEKKKKKPKRKTKTDPNIQYVSTRSFSLHIQINTLLA